VPTAAWADVQAALFDFDGTLVSGTIDFAAMRRAILALIAGYGVDPAPLAPLPSLEAVARAKAALSPEAAAELDRRADGVLREIELEAAGRTLPLPRVPAFAGAAGRERPQGGHRHPQLPAGGGAGCWPPRR
jgi:phosphoglycolate phosphatase-like HAD superfamily hydrolase